MTMHVSAAAAWSCNTRIGAGCSLLAEPSLPKLRSAACMNYANQRCP